MTLNKIVTAKVTCTTPSYIKAFTELFSTAFYLAPICNLLDLKGADLQLFRLSNGGFYMSLVTANKFSLICHPEFQEFHESKGNILTGDGLGLLISKWIFSDMAQMNRDTVFGDLFSDMGCYITEFENSHPEGELVGLSFQTCSFTSGVSTSHQPKITNLNSKVIPFRARL